MPRSIVPTQPKNLRQQWNFSVEINGFDAAYFTKADRPKVNHAKVNFDGAGSWRTEKAAGKVEYPDLTLEKGVSADGADRAILDWLSQQMQFLTGVGQPPSGYIKDVALVEYNRQGAEINRWTLVGAWVLEYDGGSLDGSSSENVIETITLCYQDLLV